MSAAIISRRGRAFVVCARDPQVWALVAGALLSASATAADADAGRAKAQACSVCHGPQGLSVAPDAPHLAAQPAIYIEAQLKAFRSGKRQHEVMNVMARPLSDADIANLAAWFASIRVEVQAGR